MARRTWISRGLTSPATTATGPALVTRGLVPTLGLGSLPTRALGGGVVVALPGTLLAAIRAYWEGPSGLASSVGPLYAGRVRPGQAVPYARIQEITRRPSFTTGPGYTEQIDLQLSIFATGESDAEARGSLVAAALDFVRLTFADGYLMVMVRTGGLLMIDPEPGPDGRTVFHRAWTYRALVGRNRS